MTVTNPSSIRAIDLFCGVGGLTHGLETSGIDVACGVDVVGSCRFAYEANNAAKFVESDVRKLSSEWMREEFGTSAITLLAGCAPCQPFSSYSRTVRDTRTGENRNDSGKDDWTLVRAFGQLIRDVSPDLVTMENVPGLQLTDVFNEMLLSLEGYHIDYKVVDATKVGLPQTRKRLVLVASKLGPITLPEFAHKPVSVRDVIGSLPHLEAGGVDSSDLLHRSASLSDKNLQRIKASKQGGTWRDWPEELLADCHTKASGIYYSSVYGRMTWDAPSPTITTQCYGFGNGRFGHPEQNRAISLREAAMLQGFPRTYAFVAPDEKVRFNKLGRLIGNAVPVTLAKAIGDVLVDHVESVRGTAVANSSAA